MDKEDKYPIKNAPTIFAINVPSGNPESTLRVDKTYLSNAPNKPPINTNKYCILSHLFIIFITINTNR